MVWLKNVAQIVLAEGCHILKRIKFISIDINVASYGQFSYLANIELD